MTKVTFRPNPNAAKQVAVLAEVATAKMAGKVRDDAKRIVRDEGRVNTGLLMQSIESRQVTKNAFRVTYEVGSRLSYAITQHEGVEGPVLPKRALVLRFKPKPGSPPPPPKIGKNGKVLKRKPNPGGWVFARSTKGFEGIHYLTRALDKLSARDAV